MKQGIFPGSFDPVTCGHLDLIERAAKLTEHLTVAVLYNAAKGGGFFTVEERVAMLEEVTSHLPNVNVECFSGLLVDYAQIKQADVIIRGVRSAKDLENEMPMAQINKQLGKGLDTIFLITAPQYAAISSSAVRELALFNRIGEQMVPNFVEIQIQNKIKIKG